MDPTEPVVIKDASDIHTLVGNGKYQIAVVLIGQLIIFAVAMQEFILNFAALDKGWKCKVRSEMCLLNGTISPENNLRCKMNRSEWIFDGDKTFSIVNEFELDCKDEYWIALSTALFYIANMIGALVLGTISDRYGRSRTAFWCTGMVLCSCFVGAFVPNLWSFEVLRVVNGFFLPGTYMVMIILTSEIVCDEHRNTAVNVYWISYSMGVSLLGVVAYTVQNWRSLFIYSSAPYFISIILLWFVPESLLWLHAQGNEKQFLHEVKKISRFNKIHVPSTIVFLQHQHTQDTKDQRSNMLSLYNTRQRLLITVPLSLGWLSSGLIYYGIELVSANLTGNMYRDFILLIIVEVPSTFMSIYSIRRFGCKISTIAGIFIGGINMVIIGFLPDTSENPAYPIIRLTLALLTKVTTSMSYNVIIMWSTELYPTNLRSKANGLLNCWYMVGAVSAPWVGISLERIHPRAPFFMMGGCLIVSAIMMCKVPDTKGQDLPEDITVISNKIDNVEL